MMIARNNAMCLAFHRAFKDAVIIRIWAILNLLGWSDPRRNLPQWTAGSQYQWRRPSEFLAQHFFHL